MPNERHENLPRVTVFQRQLRTFLVIMVGGPLVIWGGGSLVFWLFGLNWNRLLWLWVLAGPLQAGTMIWWMAALVRTRRRVREVDSALCPSCGYDLRDRGDPTICSECGLRVTDDEAREAWAVWKGRYGTSQEQAEARRRRRASAKDTARQGS